MLEQKFLSCDRNYYYCTPLLLDLKLHVRLGLKINEKDRPVEAADDEAVLAVQCGPPAALRHCFQVT